MELFLSRLPVSQHDTALSDKSQEAFLARVRLVRVGRNTKHLRDPCVPETNQIVTCIILRTVLQILLQCSSCPSAE